MKMLCIFNLLILFFLSSCISSENAEVEFEDINGELTSIRNGENWNTESLLFGDENFSRAQNWNIITPEKFTISAYFFQEYEGYEDQLIEILSIWYILPSWEKQSLLHPYDLESSRDKSKVFISLGTLVDGDAAGSKYGLDTTSTDNFVQFTKFDKKRNEIHGIFQMDLVMVERSTFQPNAPEKIRFTDGKFRAVIPTSWIEAFEGDK